MLSNANPGKLLERRSSACISVVRFDHYLIATEQIKGQTGQSLLRQYVMPYIQLRVAGNLTKEQKQEIAAQFTKTLEEVAGKPPAATYIVIEEVSRDNWAKGGKLLSDS